MVIGIIPNPNKDDIGAVIIEFVTHLKQHGMDYLISNDLDYNQFSSLIHSSCFVSNTDLFKKSDIIVSIGGDGTMLNTAYLARESSAPLVGLNIGKLGFLAEFDLNRIDELLYELKNGLYTIENRMVLEGDCLNCEVPKLFAINDIVIDKGGWPKMIEISLQVNDEYVTTFVADGLILATPTGTTGYSLSAGGPVITPTADVIALSPISPHSLTMRPLVLDSSRAIRISVTSQHEFVQVSCDGQRVYSIISPAELIIVKSEKKVSLVHVHSTNYFHILREKLYWGIDVRRKN